MGRETARFGRVALLLGASILGVFSLIAVALLLIGTDVPERILFEVTTAREPLEPSVGTATYVAYAAAAGDDRHLSWYFGRELDEPEIESMRRTVDPFPSASREEIECEEYRSTADRAEYRCTLETTDLYSVSHTLIVFEKADDAWLVTEIRAVE